MVIGNVYSLLLFDGGTSGLTGFGVLVIRHCKQKRNILQLTSHTPVVVTVQIVERTCYSKKHSQNNRSQCPRAKYFRRENGTN